MKSFLKPGAFDFGGYEKVADMAEYLGVTDRCVRDRLTEFRRYFNNERGVVTPVKHDSEKKDC